MIYIGLLFLHADTSPIMAPPNQIVIYGRTDTLNCSYADASVNPVATVERNEELLVNNEIISANLDDEGEYECDIFLPEHSASIGIPFTVDVIGKLCLSPLLLLIDPFSFSTEQCIAGRGIIINRLYHGNKQTVLKTGDKINQGHVDFMTNTTPIHS